MTADANGYAFFYAEADLYRISSMQPTIDWRYVDVGAAGALQRGNNLSDVANPATARSNLGLKGAATRDVVSSPTDTSGGNKLVTQGWMGLGGRLSNDNSTATKLAYFNQETVPSGWTMYGYGSIITLNHGYSGGCADIIITHTTNDSLAFRNSRERAWREVTHTGNIRQSTGSSTKFPMSQKAVSDQLWGVGQTWQDVLASREPAVNYTNTTGRTILVATTAIDDVDANVTISSYVGGQPVVQSTVTAPGGGGGVASITFAVPPGASYRCNLGTGDTLRSWVELR